jgi:hypothetical protein
MDKGKHENDRVEEHFKYSSPIPKSHLTISNSKISFNNFFLFREKRDSLIARRECAS